MDQQGVPNKAGELDSRSARRGGRFCAIHVGSAEEISYVFALCEIKSMRKLSSLNAKEVGQGPQIFDCKFTLQVANKT